MHNTKNCSIFVLLNKNSYKMNKEKVLMEVTLEEKELLEVIRNYNNSYPNGYPQLLWFAQEVFDNMLRQPYE